MNMPNAVPTQKPIATSRRTSGPRRPVRRGLSRLLMSGGNPSAKMKSEVNRGGFFRASMKDQHINAARVESTRGCHFSLPPFCLLLLRVKYDGWKYEDEVRIFADLAMADN